MEEKDQEKALAEWKAEWAEQQERNPNLKKPISEIQKVIALSIEHLSTVHLPM